MPQSFLGLTGIMLKILSWNSSITLHIKILVLGPICHVRNIYLFYIKFKWRKCLSFAVGPLTKSADFIRLVAQYGYSYLAYKWFSLHLYQPYLCVFLRIISYSKHLTFLEATDTNATSYFVQKL